MPILIKNYSWRQTDVRLIIRVPLNGIHCSKVDIFTVENYIKASYPPFLFEVFLHSKVDNSQSKCTFTEEDIVFELVKVQPESWEKLETDLNREQKKKLRQEFVEKAHFNAKEERQRKAEKKSKIRREAVKEQIDLDSKEREIIEGVRNHERHVAMKDLEEWKSSQPEQKVSESNLWKQDILQPKKETLNEKQKKTVPRHLMKQIFHSHTRKFVEKDALSEDLPSPRESGNIRVTFTPRMFPTPSRESKHEEEQEWLKKQAEARRRIGFVEEDLTPEEQDPQWLKEKGDSFFKVGNYLGAVSAYSYGIKLSEKMASLYANRAAAHMALGNLHKAIGDCSQALELMTPCVSLNATSRARCYARRGAALCSLRAPKEGLADLQEAVRLHPNDESLKMDLQRAEKMVEQMPDSCSDEELDLLD